MSFSLPYLCLRAAGIALAWLAAAAVLGGAIISADAHEGHDHGPPVPAAVRAAHPKLALQSETYEFVASVADGHIRIYLDRFADNEPVTDAKISFSAGGHTIEALPQANGTYLAEAGPLALPGRHEVVVTINGPQGDDLLIGVLEAPHPAAAAPVNPSATPVRIWIYVLAALVIGLGFGLLLRARRRPSAADRMAPLVVGLVLLGAPSLAHEGHDHGPAGEQSPGQSDAAQRLEDGSLFVPKVTQRLFEIRTMIVKPGGARRSVTFAGRIIPDPNSSGLVQSRNGGRLKAPPGGLPRLGQAVKKGDVLLEVESPIPVADTSDLAGKTGEIDQQIALTEVKIERLRRLLKVNAAPQARLDDAIIELQGLRQRSAAMQKFQVKPEILRAPVDGVIAAMRATLGQVVQAQDVLFEINDPNRLWVEALAFDPGRAAVITGAAAQMQDGSVLQLNFIGKSSTLKQQAMQLHFSIAAPPAGLSVGTPVTVLAQGAEVLQAKLLPKDAVVKGSNGEDLVFEHTQPERFVPHQVRAKPFDGERVMIEAGIEDKQRIVTRAAELLNQIR